MPLFNLAKATTQASKEATGMEPITATEEFGTRFDKNVNNRPKNWPFSLDDAYKANKSGDKSGDDGDDGDDEVDEDEVNEVEVNEVEVDEVEVNEVDEIETNQDLRFQRLKLQSKCTLQGKLRHLEFEHRQQAESVVTLHRCHQQTTIDLAIKYLRDGLNDVRTWTGLSRDVRDDWNAQLRRELIKVRKTAAKHLMNSLSSRQLPA